ncbi:hypothetical protein [Microbacterium sp. C7(2022)]|uniref:hypothetical protein n=1 Tax=Microbacterium sp. C7(2022) TaxID=2992759 RepID=UPI00237A314F|nr:hypothetical protein [Microbacterium sp. C7(2022)]MDE0547515.1 hypothetical protein [Microbacterium sp. C7(2022)]
MPHTRNRHSPDLRSLRRPLRRILITIGWAIYAKVSGSLEQRAGELYDRAGGGPAVRPESDTATSTAAESAEKAAARQELRDGLTPEQRKMFDDLDNR